MDLNKTDSTQKCYYCKKNQSEKEFMNSEESNSTEVEFKGIYKHKTKTKKSWEVIRCKECFENHKKVDKITSNLYFIVYYLQFNIIKNIYIFRKCISL